MEILYELIQDMNNVSNQEDLTNFLIKEFDELDYYINNTEFTQTIKSYLINRYEMVKRLKDVDEEMIPYIEQINKFNHFVVMFCCSGHYITEKEYKNFKDFDEFLELSTKESGYLFMKFDSNVKEKILKVLLKMDLKELDFEIDTSSDKLTIRYNRTNYKKIIDSFIDNLKNEFSS